MFEFNTPKGNERSDAIFNVVDVLVRQNKTFMEGKITHRDSNTVWTYQIIKVMKGDYEK